MYYTYVLKRLDAPGFYTGSTDNLKRRLLEHRKGRVHQTSKGEWTLHCYFAFCSEKRARSFEQYLKSGSGRAFAKRHFEF